MGSSAETPSAPPGSRPPPLLERLGVRYFRRLSTSARAARSADAVSVLNADERKELVRITRGAVVRACAAGALSALAAAVAEVLAERALGPAPGAASLSDQARYWAVIIGVTAVASVFEVLFLYWDSLRSVHNLACAAGLDMFQESEQITGADPADEPAAVAAALARAALELPNPVHPVFGVNPRRETSKVKLFFASLIYKLKVSATNFALKTLVRRVLGRALVRTWLLPFIAVPVTAVWNGVVTWVVLREARIRAMGPSAAKELVGAVFDGDPAELSPAGRQALVRAVASAIVRTGDIHPNLFAALRETRARVGAGKDAGAGSEMDAHADDAIDDSRAFLRLLPKLSPSEQRTALRMLVVAAILDGRFTAPEKRLLGEALASCGRPLDLRPAEQLRRAFVAGDADLDKRVKEVA
jgi:hypothetical protein